MQYDHAEGPWVETDVKLVIRKADLDPALLASELSLAPTSVSLPSAGSPTVEAGEGVWALPVHKRLPGGVNSQLEELLLHIGSRSASFSSLAARGYEISIQVSGFVGRGSTFALTPDVVQRLASLDIPLVVSTSTSDR
jgi:hypothetical protein